MGCSGSKVQREGVAQPAPVVAVTEPAEPPPAAGPTLPVRDRKATTKAATTEELPAPSPVNHISHAPSAPAIHGIPMSPPSGGGEAPKRNMRFARTMPAGTLATNGFKTIPEIPSFSIEEKHIAPFTLPTEALTFQPSKDAVVTAFKNGDSERKIHLNIELSESELDRLSQLRQEAKMDAEAAFYPSVTCMATRFLSRARGDPKKAIKLMKATQAWRQEYFGAGAISDASVMEDMKHGIVYFTGRDFAMRPAIVVRAHRIPQQWYKDKCVDRFIKMLIFCMEYFQRYMVVPGRIENLSVIVDLQGLGISQVPISALAEVYSVMSHHYMGRVYKFYVCNVSYVLSSIAGMVKALLTDRQKQKLTMLDSVNDLRQDFALHQLEQDLGGSREAFTTFFPFPLTPGPFEAGFSGGATEDAVEGGHVVLTHAGALGRLWDPKASAQENARLNYGPKAASIFEQCGLPVPPEARFDYGEHDAQDAEADVEGCDVGNTVSTDVGTPGTALDETDTSATAKAMPPAIEVDDSQRGPTGSGFFCCRA